jgi:excisionase family DNA binding protein
MLDTGSCGIYGLCMTQLSPFLTAEQVAERFDVTAETAREWARTGKVPAVRTPGGHYRFRREDIEAIERGETPASAA